MMVVFIVSDEDEQNWPSDMDELNRKLAEIRASVPQPPIKQKGNNMFFVVKAFTLFKNCGLITKDLVEKLNDVQWSNSAFGNVKMNPLGGVLRKDGLTMWDETNLRYYCPYDELKVDSDIDTAKSKAWRGESKLAVICEGVTYYISNDWFSQDKPRPTKEVFVNWLKEKTTDACQKHWAQNELMPSNNSTPAKAPTVVPPQTAATVSPKTSTREDSLQMVIKSLDELHKKVDNLDKKIQLLGDDMHKELDEVKKEMNSLSEIWK